MNERESTFQLLPLQERVKNAIAAKNEIIEIIFYDSDFPEYVSEKDLKNYGTDYLKSANDHSKQGELNKLKLALQSFKQVKFVLEADKNVTKFKFVTFATDFLKTAKNLEEFDASGNSCFSFSDNPLKGAKLKQRLAEKEIKKEYPKTVGDFLHDVFTHKSLQKINLSGSYLKPDTLKEYVFLALNHASSLGKVIDLRNLLNGEKFTLHQIYQIVVPESAEKKAQILISVSELPESLQKAVSSSDEDFVDLLEISELIIEVYKNELFNEKIKAIEKSVNSRALIQIEFNASLDKLTDEQTQRLAQALQTKKVTTHSLH